MKELILIIIALLALISASFSQTTSDNPEYFIDPNDSKRENSNIAYNCKDICLETDKHGTCIKVEVQCDN
ncbi:MAG: hypothetical protein ACR2NW_03360 [Thermodesulfobacteriota bacterium]